MPARSMTVKASWMSLAWLGMMAAYPAGGQMSLPDSVTGASSPCQQPGTGQGQQQRGGVRNLGDTETDDILEGLREAEVTMRRTQR